MRRNGFSLVELVVVVLIMGIVAAVAGPRMFNLRGEAEDNTFATQIQRFNDAAILYRAKNGNWPAEAAAGVMPPELVPSFSQDFFAEDTLYGCSFDWNNNPAEPIGLSLYKKNPSPQWSTLDAEFDDGNLATGKVQQVNTNWLVFILEE